MKKQILVLIGIAIVITQFWGCNEDTNIFGSIKGSGHIIDVEYSFNNYNRIDVSNAFELTVKQSDTFHVVLFVDDNIVQYLDIRRSGDWLIIDMEDDHNYNNVELRAEIHMPEIDFLKGSGATAISMNGFTDSTEFRMELSGASVFSANLITNECEIYLSGASVINLNGSCNKLYFESSGASELNMGSFVAKEAFFIMSGASDGTINVTDHLDVTLSGASVLRYYGDPEIGNLNITGASSLIKL